MEEQEIAAEREFLDSYLRTIGKGLDLLKMRRANAKSEDEMNYWNFKIWALNEQWNVLFMLRGLYE